MNELHDLKSTRKADHVASPERQALLADATKSVFDTFRERPLETAGGALFTATLGVASLRLKFPALEKLATADAVSLAKTSLRFGKFPELPPGKFVIPSFRTEGGPLRETLRTIPEFKIVNTESADARIFNFARASIHKIVSKDGTGSGFLVDESGLIATANHVVKNPELPYFLRLMDGDVPARLVARDVANDVAILKVDRSMKTTRPLELNLDAYSREKGAINSLVREWDEGIVLDREAFLIGFPDGAVQRVMTKGPAITIGLFKNLSPEARLIDGQRLEFFQQAKVMHRVTSFGGYSGSPLVLENGLVVGIHTDGRYGGNFARATSVHHLARLLDEVRLRPMVSGFGDYITPVLVSVTDSAKQIVRTTNPARLAHPVQTTVTVKIPPISKPNA